MRDADEQESGRGGGLRKRKYPCYKPSTHYRQMGERQPVGGKSRCVFEWQIRGIASLMHR